MPISPEINRRLVGSVQAFVVMPDDFDTQAFTSDFVVGDISVTNNGVVSDFVLEDDFSEATFNVTLPRGARTVLVTVDADSVTGLASDLTSRIRLVRYLWSDQDTIQSYLDGERSIQIRDDDGAEIADVVKNFSQVAATGLENESVFEIATLLSMVFEPSITDADPDVGGTIDLGVYGNTPLGFKQADDTVLAGTFCPQYLCLLVGRLTASKIATVRLGASLSTLPNWVRAYKNEVYSQLQRWAVNAETATINGLSLRADFDLADVLMKMKTREHTAEDLEN